MRKLLISTALLTVAFAPVAKAEMEVTLGGYVNFQAAMFDNDAANNSDRDFQSESELKVTAKGTADNGLEYGAYIEVFASTTDTSNTDEVNLYLKGGWGKLELGDQDGAASAMGFAAPYVGIGQVFGSYVDYVPTADRGYRNAESAADTFMKVIDTYDDTKVTYYSPKFAGFQAGVSYVPELGSEGEGVVFTDTTSDFRDGFEFGLGYEGELSGVKVKGVGTYTMADSTSNAVEDLSSWGLGLQLGYQGFTFGGNYVDDGDSGLASATTNDNVKKYSLGATYEADAWGVGLSYAQVDFDQNGVSYDSAGGTGSGGDYTAWGAGATYKIAPGLTAGADLVFFDRNRDTGTDSDGYVFVTEVRAAF